MKILITGIAGFVGSSLARALLNMSSEVQIIGIDNLSFGYLERLEDIKSRIIFHQHDIARLNEVVNGEAIDIIVHCAAITPLPECQIDSHRAIVQNVANCGSVADFAIKYGIKNIIFFSSGAIYEGVTEFPTPENIDIKTKLTYPATKYMAEIYYESMCRSYGINVTALRLFNLYGPHQDYFRKQPPLIGYLLKCLILKQQAILFSTGNQCRDYIYIDDLLDLINLLISKMLSDNSSGQFLSLNVANGKPISVNEVITILEEISNEKIDIMRNPPTQYWNKYEQLKLGKITLNTKIIQDEVQKFTHASLIKTQDIFCWKAKISMKIGLMKCYEFAKTNLLKESK